MSEGVKGIVLHYTDYRDNDRMLSLLTKEKGRIDAKARNCRKATSPLLSCTQPFILGAFQLFANKGKYTVDSAEVLESFYPLREDVERYAAASLCTGLSRCAVQEEEPNEALFSLLYTSLSFLAYGDNTPKDALICFLIRFLSVAGYCPAITRCAVCGRDIRSDGFIRFDAEKGGAVCAACSAFGAKVSPTALEAMRRMLLLEDQEMGRVKLKEPLQKELLSLLVPYALSYFPNVQKAADLFSSL